MMGGCPLVDTPRSPQGPLKDAPVGPWTPPALVLELYGLSVYSVDELGRLLDLRTIWKQTNSKKKVLICPQVLYLFVIKK